MLGVLAVGGNATALAGGGAPWAANAPSQSWPGAMDGDVYETWEYPDFAWSDEDADVFATWVPPGAASDEPLGALDWSSATELVDRRTATTRTYLFDDTGWTVVRAWAAPVHRLDADGAWQNISTMPVATELVPSQSHRVDEHPTPMALPHAMGDSGVEVELQGLPSPLRFGLNPRLFGDDGSLDLAADGATLDDDGVVGWIGKAARHDVAALGDGVLHVVSEVGGGLFEAHAIEQRIQLPEGTTLKPRDDGSLLLVATAHDTVVGSVTALAYAPLGGRGGVATLVTTNASDGTLLTAKIPPGVVEQGLRALSVRWRFGATSMAPDFGLLAADVAADGAVPTDAALSHRCLACADGSQRRGVWMALDYAGHEEGVGAHRGWFDAAEAPALSDAGLGFSWSSPNAWDAHDEPASDAAALWLAWPLPAGASTVDGLRVGTGDRVEGTAARALAAAGRGAMLLHTGAAGVDLADDPFALLALSSLSFSTDAWIGDTYPYMGLELAGECHGHACWSILGWSLHGTHTDTDLFARTEGGISITVTEAAGCAAAVESVDASVATPWIDIQAQTQDRAVRWFDTLSLSGDWTTQSATIELEYRFRHDDWSTTSWERVPDGVHLEGSPHWVENGDGSRDVISWEKQSLSKSVRDVQMRYRVVGEACFASDAAVGLGDDPLAAAKEAGAQVSTFAHVSCSGGTCYHSGLQCGYCACFSGSCKFGGNGFHSKCWPCGGSATDTGQCRRGDRTCSNGKLSGCSNYICPSTEKCGDSVDNDCDGAVDEEGASGCTWYYHDGDNDGYGTNSAKCLCAKSGNYRATANGDCHDGNGSIYPGAPEKCNGVNDDCDGAVDEGVGVSGCSSWYWDNDNDGYGTNSSQCRCKAAGKWRATTNGDCNDSNADQSPGDPERCWTGYDDNCNGNTNDQNASGCSTFYWDNDGDSWGTNSSRCYCSPAGKWRATQKLDCADSDGDVFPGQTEVCNGKDDNCVGGIDDGLGSVTCGKGECFHSQPKCVGGVTQSCDPFQGSAPESCDGKDNDCDGSVDENWNLGQPCDGTDADLCADGVLACNGSGGASCNDDASSKVEICNGSDDDCDGVVDEENANGCSIFYYDGDGDTHGVAGNARCLCSASGAYTGTVADDCNDGDGAVHPGHTEWCDYKDNDCDGVKDEGYNLGAACDSGDADKCNDGRIQCSGNTSTKCDGELTLAWDFDNGLADSSGSGKTLSIGNQASITSSGRNGNGAQFDGVNDYMARSHSTDMLPTEGITISTWVNPATGMNCNSGNNWRYLAAKSGWGEYHLIFEQSYQIGWTVRVNGSDQRLWSGGNTLPANTWTHYVATYNLKTGEQKSYINGVLKTQRVGKVGSLPNYGGQLRVGNWSANSTCRSGSGAFPGKVDDFMMYRRALTAAEIGNIYNRGGRPSNQSGYGINVEFCDGYDNDCDGAVDEGIAVGASCEGSDADLCTDNRVSCAEWGHGTECTEGAVGRWIIDENADSTVTDRSGFSNDGTAYNVAFGAEGGYFNGSNSYILVPGDSTLNAPSYSMSVWVKPEVDNDYWTGVFGQYGNGRSMHFWLGKNNGPGPYYLHHTGKVPGNSNYACNNNNAVPADTWTHVVITHDRDGRRRNYINGNLTCNIDSPGANLATGDTRNIVIGRNLDGGASNYFKGWIKEVTLFRHSMTPTEVAEMYASDGDFTENLDICDFEDNDCDGTADNGFSLNATCDGGDPDLCTDGRVICDTEGGGTFCRDSSPVGSWDFDEGAGTTTADVTDNTNPRDGTFQGAPDWVPGKFGKALKFDGDDAVNVGHYSELSINTRTMAMEAWVRNPGGTFDGIILNKESTYEIAVRSGGRFACAINTTETGWFWINAGFVNDGSWHHVVCQLADDGRIKLYVDGALSAQSAVVLINGLVKPTTQPLRIARRAGGSYFHGEIDEVAVYDYALTASEIADHASAGELLNQKNFERCDDRDNNCMGGIDETWAGKGQLCGTGDCAGGANECVASMDALACSSMPGGSDPQVQAETCDGSDNDCDSAVDEDFTYSNGGFSGPVGTSCDGVGQCGVGLVECLNPTTATCSTNANGSNPQSQPEVCDYIDNDCDGVADDGLTYLGTPLGGACDGIGECGIGFVECNVGTVTPTCSSNADGSAPQVAVETCNTKDDNCNGVVDEGFFYADPVTGTFRSIGQSCYGYGTCGLGTVECGPGNIATCSTNPGQSEDNAVNETCDGFDNDCDGSVDNYPAGGPLSGQLTVPCYTGPLATTDVGECHGGIRTCIGGTWGSCVGQQLPASGDMICDGKDENCDGQADEHYAPIPCGVGECGRTSTCSGGVETACVPGPPTSDANCDGLDNDCDTEVDEHFVATSCGVGVCASESQCWAGTELPCVVGSPTMGNEAQNCDGLDNDCDGQVDENYDDGIACTVSSCTNGIPSDIPDHAYCDDSEPCTDDTCTQFDCVSLPDNTNAPDPSFVDTNPCTRLQCFAGASQNLPDNALIPDDSLACTTDYCVAGQQYHDINPGLCLVDGVCYSQGETDPLNSCGVCYPDETNTEFTSTLLRDHFDVGGAAGWTFDDATGSGVNWQLDNGRAHSAPNSIYMGNPVTRTYEGFGRIEAHATSPSVALPAGVVSILGFRLWLQTEAFNQAIQYDVLFLDVIEADGTETTVWNSVEEANGTTAGDFRQFTVDLGDFAGKTVSLRFRFDSGDDYFNDYEGAYVDAIELRTACCADAGDCDDADDCTIDSCQGEVCNYIHTCDECAPTPVNMMVLLDFSGSMNGQAGPDTSLSKWQAATEALGETLDTFGPVLNNSLKLFKSPGSSPCFVSDGGLELDWHSSAFDVETFLTALVPGGLTPMTAGLYGAQTAYENSGLEGTRYVLLITDGVETCGGDPVAAVEALFADDIHVYVVGFDPGSGFNIDHDTLNLMAEAGGHGRDIESASEPAYYKATTSEELDQAMNDIFGEAAGEQCNGIDDDCDGTIDDGVAPIVCNVTCGLHGIAGKQHCTDGEFGPCTVNPDAELCNGLDDDCNGTIDDHWTDGVGDRLGDPCTVGIGECAEDGVFICPADQTSEPVCDAVPGAPVAETCDNLDNDCDGFIDNDLEQVCCTACGCGTEVCIAGSWVNCNAPPVLPDDQCDYIDNDCDGVTDPLFPEIHSECDSEDSDFCLNGTFTCNALETASECVNEDPYGLLEQCDGVEDEDCDGVVDEDDAVGCIDRWYDKDEDLFGDAGPRCLCEPIDKWTALVGDDCNDDEPKSFPGNPEVCDNIDNDCNAFTDEDPDNVGAALNRSCYEGPAGTLDVGICHAGTETCFVGQWSLCIDQVMPQTEVCNGLDDDCDGFEDPDEPNTAAGETADDHACAGDPNCTLGTCFCVENDQTNVWSCILE